MPNGTVDVFFALTCEVGRFLLSSIQIVQINCFVLWVWVIVECQRPRVETQTSSRHKHKHNLSCNSNLSHKHDLPYYAIWVRMSSIQRTRRWRTLNSGEQSTINTKNSICHTFFLEMSIFSWPVGLECISCVFIYSKGRERLFTLLFIYLKIKSITFTAVHASIHKIPCFSNSVSFLACVPIPTFINYNLKTQYWKGGKGNKHKIISIMKYTLLFIKYNYIMSIYKMNMRVLN